MYIYIKYKIEFYNKIIINVDLIFIILYIMNLYLYLPLNHKTSINL